MPYWLPALPDPSLDAFDDGVGVLSRDGAEAGHVATVRRQFHGLVARRRRWWIWYLIVWEDGTREPSQEDYPPFLAVREMLAGYFDVDFSTQASREGRYDFVWLPRGEADATRTRLGIRDTDF